MKIGLDVYWGNEYTGRLEINDLTLIKNECYIDGNSIGCVAKYPFKNIKDGKNAIEMLMDRVVPPERANIKEILEAYGLKEYNWFELLKKTHGACMDDFLWFKIDSNNDENLTFKNVHGRANECETI